MDDFLTRISIEGKHQANVAHASQRAIRIFCKSARDSLSLPFADVCGKGASPRLIASQYRRGPRALGLLNGAIKLRCIRRGVVKSEDPLAVSDERARNRHPGSRREQCWSVLNLIVVPG